MLLVINIKMNFTQDKLYEYKDIIDNKNVVILPQYPYISLFSDSNILVGAQDVSEHIKGSYTGEVCAKALKDIGCSYVLVHHYEREKYFNETLESAKDKISNVYNNDMTPIYCVNDDNGDLDSKLDIIKDITRPIVIAYEPVWLIGGSLKMDDVHIIESKINYIKEYLNNHNIQYKLIYGGGIDSTNINYLKNIDGFIISSNALQVENFKEMLKKLI